VLLVACDWTVHPEPDLGLVVMIENKIIAQRDTVDLHSNTVQPNSARLETPKNSKPLGNATAGSRYPLQTRVSTERSTAAQTGICGRSTLITPYGIENVSGLAVGDRVLTVEAGFLPIRKIQKDVLAEDHGRKPICSVDTTSDEYFAIYLSPYQLVKLAGSQSVEPTGNKRFLIQARFLIGISGFSECDSRETVFFNLEFDRPATVWLNSKYIQGIHCAASAEPDCIESGEQLDHSQSIKWRQNQLATVIGRSPADLC
jgi:hypothetical protein